jgi:hypothetical protein
MKTKICNDCREEKPLSEFGKDANTKDGIRRICKECARVRTQDYRASGMVRKRLDAPVIDGTKQCPWCLESRTLAEFSDFYKGRVCNTCRELDFQRKFGHNIDPSTGMKQCSKCSRWLPFSAFSVKRSGFAPGAKARLKLLKPQWEASRLPQALKRHRKICQRLQQASHSRMSWALSARIALMHSNALTTMLLQTSTPSFVPGVIKQNP